MKRSKPAFLPLFFTLILLGSCELEKYEEVLLPEGHFWALDMVSKKYYSLKADVLYEGERCVILAEQNSRITVTKEIAEEIAGEFDTKIYPSVVENFGKKDVSFMGIDFDSIMEFAGWLVNGDGKLTILLLDIRDGFENPGTDSYVAGYFSPMDIIYPQGDRKSNGSCMIYVDTYPGMDPELKLLKETYKTLTHEFQHLINFVTSVCSRNIMIGNTRYIYEMDTWIDEGLSSQAEYLYSEVQLENRINYYKEDPAGTIARGNNFYVWGNYSEKNAILDEYATVYLFFQWLYLQADESFKSSLFYDIVTSNYSNHRAVTEVAGKINAQWINWETLLRTWLAANYINDPDNEYGYKWSNDNGPLKSIKAKTISYDNGKGVEEVIIADKTYYKVELYPGEGVFSFIDSQTPFSPSASGGHIKYAGLDTASITSHENPSDPYTGKVLLTFNTNTPENNYTISAKDKETGYVTGFIGSAKALLTPGELTGSGPWVIDARDALGRQRNGEWPRIFPVKNIKNE